VYAKPSKLLSAADADAVDVVALKLPLIQFMMVDAADVVDAVPCSWRVLANARGWAVEQW